MLISIIIPVYNTKDYLQKCVDSVLKNDCTDCEILLIDDGSTDGKSGALCDRMAAKQPALIRVIHQENKGLGGARNTGIAEAKGDYLFFLDSDDSIVPDALGLLKDAIRRTAAQIISFHMLEENEAGLGAKVSICPFTAEQPFTLKQQPAYLLSMPSACCRIWKRSLFLESGIRFPDRVWYEDIRTTSKLFALATSITVLPDALYVYYSRSGSITRSANVARNKEIIDAFEEILVWYRKEGFFDSYRPFLCRLCIEHLYIAASVRVLKENPRHPLLKEFGTYIKEQFPDYQQKEYRAHLSRLVQLVFFLLEKKQYSLIAFLFRLKA